MILGIDASNIRSGGGLTHLVELLRAFNPKNCKYKKIIIWSSLKTLDRLIDQRWILKRNHHYLNKNFLYRVFWQWKYLDKQAKQENCSLIFVPGSSFIFSFRPVVTMNQNLLPFKWNEIKRYGFSLSTLKFLFLRFSQSISFHNANGIIFLTQNAYSSVLKKTGKLKGSTIIIPHGVHKRFFHKPRSQKIVFKGQFEAPIKLIYLSSIEPYKHHDKVIKAVDQLIQNQIPIILDIYGSSSRSKAISKLKKIINKHDLFEKYIRYKGSVKHENIHELYLEYDIAIFASSCETFGQILLEGLASGIPTASSNMSSLPEILGDSVTYFNPTNIDSIFSSLSAFINSPNLRIEKAKKGYELAKKF
ncbi:uncharacterized protein METZ01_LOCUS310899, partial [marine metagenome]